MTSALLNFVPKSSKGREKEEREKERKKKRERKKRKRQRTIEKSEKELKCRE